MAFCDRCGELAVLLARTEAATLNENGEPESGRLCRECWPDEWDWPFTEDGGLPTGGGVAGNDVVDTTVDCTECGHAMTPFNPLADSHICRQCLEGIQIGDRFQGDGS